MGLQREGVAATIKHFVGNESEFERMTISSEIAERPLRELYLAPFEAAVKEAGTWALMSSYNRLNGTYVSEEPRLLRDILKGEWGFGRRGHVGLVRHPQYRCCLEWWDGPGDARPDALPGRAVGRRC